MRNMKHKLISAVLAVLFFIGVFSCSSSPKRQMLVTQISDTAAGFYESANAELLAGKTSSAGGYLQQAYNLAMSVDNADLLCRITLSAVIYKLAAERGTDFPDNSSDSPFYALSSYDLLSLARSYALRSEDSELMEAVCFLYEARIRISKNEEIDVDAVLSSVNSDAKVLSKDAYYYAFMFRTEGDLYAYAGNYREARNAYLSAAKIHVKERYLNEIGLDYYNAARMSSLAGEKQTAAQEIDIALKYDKDAENTSAIAADYFAYGLILVKGGCSDSEKERARKSMLWAAQIYQTGGYDEDAARCRQQAEAL